MNASTNSSSQNYKRTRLACYTAYFTMSSVFCVPPLLFVTFHGLYGISYTLLGTLVLINFFTQLSTDLVFTFFSKHFNVAKAVRIMPVATSVGLMIYALGAALFPDSAYLWFVAGTVIFSVSAGLSEVLLSPIIAALPSDDAQKSMSFLHSLYAFGVVATVSVSTLFLKLFGTDRWMYLIAFLALLPLIAAVLFMISPVPPLNEGADGEKAERRKGKAVGLALCAACIFFGSCAENGMSNWISSFMENALNIDKTVGDILGAAMFAVLLGAGRIAYSKFGKSINRVLFVGMLGSACCYLTAGLSRSPVPAFIACIFTGLFTAMLWPGTLIFMEKNITGAGVAAYAMMAAAGDLGASISPQLMGIVIDSFSATGFAAKLSASLGLTAEQLGLKAAMITNAVFPTAGVIVLIFIIKHFKKTAPRQNKEPHSGMRH